MSTCLVNGKVRQMADIVSSQWEVLPVQNLGHGLLEAVDGPEEMYALLVGVQQCFLVVPLQPTQPGIVSGLHKQNSTQIIW